MLQKTHFPLTPFPISFDTLIAKLTAATLLGCVIAILPLPCKRADKIYCGICVLFPQPVSPIIINVLCRLMYSNNLCRCSYTGSLRFCSWMLIFVLSLLALLPLLLFSEDMFALNVSSVSFIFLGDGWPFLLLNTTGLGFNFVCSFDFMSPMLYFESISILVWLARMAISREVYVKDARLYTTTYRVYFNHSIYFKIYSFQFRKILFISL